MLITGGTPSRRFRVAHTFHRRSTVRRGPLVCLDAVREENSLRAALQSWMSAQPGAAAGPIAAAEHGTLYIEGIAGLSPATQRLLVEFATRYLNASGTESPRPWTGRLVAGDGALLRRKLRSGGFDLALYDALDKIKIDLPAVRRPLARRLSA